MHRIITRGLGYGDNGIVARGYGDLWQRVRREVLRLTSEVTRVLRVVSRWRPTV